MGIFDIFTGDSAKTAANQNAGLFQGYGRAANQIYGNYGDQANAALTGGVQGATGALDVGLNNATGAIKSGVADATGYGQQAVDAYAPLSALGGKYGGATSLYLDALGVNGAGGADRAKNAFTTGPGYQFAVDEATKAAARNAASLGLAGSGNALDEIRNRAQGFASQEYNGYLDRLGGFVNPELQATSGAASGIAGGYRNLGDISLAGGNALAGLNTADANARAGIYTGDAANRVGVAGNVASGLAGTQRDVTSGLASSNNAVAQAQQNGSSTFWNGLFNLGGAVAKGAFGGARPATV